MLIFVPLFLLGTNLPVKDNTHQQWLGPSQETGQAIFYRPSCDTQGEHCKKCLDLGNSGSTKNGAPIEIWTCTGSAHQRWTYNTTDFTVRYQADTSKCIDLPGSDTANGNRLWLWDCHEGKQQKWLGS